MHTVFVPLAAHAPITTHQSFFQFEICGIINCPLKSSHTHLALPTYFTSNIQEAYQRQINSQFFVTQPGIKPGTNWLKDEGANE